ncbi:hypothetical protein CGRA01v4_04317 [Colletotrichum graminicola]|nr:hypothetical protein CGRA01v4_04317 [Colletotrichum graminicola]
MSLSAPGTGLWREAMPLRLQSGVITVADSQNLDQFAFGFGLPRPTPHRRWSQASTAFVASGRYVEIFALAQASIYDTAPGLLENVLI